MTILVTVLTPEGIVMATDSRLTAISPGKEEISPYVSTDQASKLFLISNYNAGFSLAGPNILQGFTLSKTVNEIGCLKFGNLKDMAALVAQKIFSATGLPFCFHLCGHENNRQVLYKTTFQPPSGAQIKRISDNVLCVDGNYDIVDLIMNRLQQEEFTVSSLTLLDAVDFVALLVQTQIEFSRFKGKLSPVGGPVDVLVITQEQAYFASQKVLRLLSPDVSRFRTSPYSPS